MQRYFHPERLSENVLAALVTAKTWKQSKCLSAVECVSKYTHHLESPPFPFSELTVGRSIEIPGRVRPPINILWVVGIDGVTAFRMCLILTTLQHRYFRYPHFTDGETKAEQVRMRFQNMLTAQNEVLFELEQAGSALRMGDTESQE